METAMTHTEVALQNILVPTDFSATSERALQYALTIAIRYHSRVRLVHVIDRIGVEFAASEGMLEVSEVYEKMRHAAEERLLRQARELTAVRHQIHVTDGAPSEAVESLVRKYHMDLIVMGTRGATKLEKLVLGSTAEEIFRSATCPVLTIGPEAPVMAASRGLNRILFPTDLMSDESGALAHALSLAKRYQAHLSLLHVIPGMDPIPATEKEEFERPYFSRLARLIPQNAELPYPPEYRIEYRDPAPDVILRIAGEVAADLIVLSVRPKERWAARLPDKAYRIVAGAWCPVLTVQETESA